MKRWLLLLLAIPLFSLSQAQNRSLSQYEYWIDGDFASRTSHTLSNSQETITFQIDTGEMTEGIHKVGFRVQDSEGNWSWNWNQVCPLLLWRKLPSKNGRSAWRI